MELYKTMMTDNRYKEAVDSEITMLNYDLEIIIEIFLNAQKTSREKFTEARNIQLEISSTLGGPSKDRERELDEALNAITNHGFVFDYITLHSLFVSAFSLFEYYFGRIAETMELYSDGRIKIDDIKGRKRDIDQIRRYLDLVHNLKSAQHDKPLWQSILKFYKIRNLITHSKSNFSNIKDKEKESILMFLKEFNVHIGRGMDFKIKDAEFLKRFKEVVVNYGIEILQEILAL